MTPTFRTTQVQRGVNCQRKVVYEPPDQQVPGRNDLIKVRKQIDDDQGDRTYVQFPIWSRELPLHFGNRALLGEDYCKMRKCQNSVTSESGVSRNPAWHHLRQTSCQKTLSRIRDRSGYQELDGGVGEKNYGQVKGRPSTRLTCEMVQYGFPTSR